MCGSSSHMWTPVTQGSVCVALVVTCGHQSNKVLYVWHEESHVDTSQARFCMCGISSHMWTPVKQGSISVALVVTCGHQSQGSVSVP
jgi:hypothetical protein